LQNFDEAVLDFKAVLELDPDNKAAKNQLAITNHKIKQIHNREKQTYAGMFQKFAEIDARVSDDDCVLLMLVFVSYSVQCAAADDKHCYVPRDPPHNFTTSSNIE